MSDYRDTIKASIEQGFYLDSCGSEERHYDWGRYIDLCGMAVEDAIPISPCCGGGGGGDSKPKNTITLYMLKNEDDKYTVHVSVEHPMQESINVSFTINGEPQLITIPSNTAIYDTQISGENPAKPYAEITNFSVLSESEDYDYKPANKIATGVFVLTIDIDGNIENVGVEYGKSYALPEVEERTGYIIKWTDDEGNELTDTYIMPERNATITCEYIVKQHVLSYSIFGEDYDNGVIESLYNSSSITLDYGTNILSALEGLTPEIGGHTLSGWKFNNESSVLPDSTMPDNDIEVKNTYKLNSYALEYISEGSTFKEENYYFNQPIVPLSTNPEKTGYIFEGWDKSVPETMPADNVTLTAQFNPITYYVTYYVDSVEKYKDQYIYEQDIVKREDESKIGYTFSGWSEIPEKMPAENVDVYGTFTINQYTLDFISDEEPYSSITGDYNSNVPEISDPEKEGYTFNGWEPDVPEKFPAEDMIFNAVFNVNSYVLTYNVSGEPYTSVTYNYGDTIIPIDAPVKEGYTFKEWIDIPQTMPAENVTVESEYTINSYVITYTINGEFYDSALTEYNSDIIPISYEAESGYTFEGWGEYPQKMPAHNIEINGVLSVNQYTLTFFVEGTEYTAITADYGSIIPEISNPEKEGYAFNGWEPELPETMPYVNMSFDAIFEINSYVASYVIDGEPYTSITYNYGAKIEYMDVPKQGYNLVWDEIYDTMPATDITINGTYEEIPEAKDIYYGAVLTTGDTKISDISGLNSFEYEEGVETPLVFTIPGNPEYTIAEEELDEEEFEEWCEEHKYSMYFATPTNVSFIFEDSTGKNISHLVSEVGEIFIVNGMQYQGYAYRTPACCIATDINSTYNLLITKN